MTIETGMSLKDVIEIIGLIIVVGVLLFITVVHESKNTETITNGEVVMPKGVATSNGISYAVGSDSVATFGSEVHVIEPNKNGKFTEEIYNTSSKNDSYKLYNKTIEMGFVPENESDKNET